MQALQELFRPSAGSHLDPASGARAAVAMFLPLFVLEVIGRNEVGASAAAGTLLGVLFVAFCDLGPTLRARALAMSAGAIIGALLMLLGSWLGSLWWWTPALALALATFASGMLPPYGMVATQAGVILTIVLAVALGKDGGLAAAVPAALGYLFGGAFFLALVLSTVILSRFQRFAARQPAPALPAPVTLSAPNKPLPSRSLLIRLALLRALGAGLIAGLTWGYGLAYPHWAPVVVIGSIRTDQAAAVSLTTQRIVGTVLGAALADVVLLWVSSPQALVVLAVVGIFLAFTVKDVNMTSFIFFLTFLTLLLLNLSATGPAYVVLRIVTTLIGAGAALVVSLLSALLARRAMANAARSSPSSPPSGATEA